MDRCSSLLIIEDERVLSECLEKHFSARGMNVAVAYSLAEARHLLGGCSFDAFLLDVGLPDGDGLSLLGELGVERSVVITGSPEPERLTSLGVRYLVPKPFNLDHVTRVLAELEFAGTSEAE